MNYSVLFRRIFGAQLTNEKMVELLHFVETNNGKMSFLIVIVFLQNKLFFLHSIDENINYKGISSF
jgi:hypothetical protein